MGSCGEDCFCAYDTFHSELFPKLALNSDVLVAFEMLELNSVMFETLWWIAASARISAMKSVSFSSSPGTASNLSETSLEIEL